MPPVFRSATPANPPQTIIRDPFQTAVCSQRAAGAPEVVVASHELRPGSYRPPVFWGMTESSSPPHTTIVAPLQTAECPSRALGAPDLVTAAQASPAGS